jgi:regulator of replication initiation timing
VQSLNFVHERCDAFEEHLRSTLQANQELQQQHKDLKQRLEEAAVIANRNTNYEFLKEVQRTSEINANATMQKIDYILQVMMEMQPQTAVRYN